MLLIGKILKPQGITGEIKILPFLDAPPEFCKVKKLIIQNREYAPLSLRVSGEYVFAKLSGIKDRNMAEALRGQDIFVRKEDAPKLPQGKYYIDSLLGSEVWAGEERIGKLTAISQYGSADVYEAEGARGKILFPFLKALIVEVDEKNKKIVLDPEEFSKVAVYED